MKKRMFVILGMAAMVIAGCSGKEEKTAELSNQNVEVEENVSKETAGETEAAKRTLKKAASIKAEEGFLNFRSNAAYALISDDEAQLYNSSGKKVADSDFVSVREEDGFYILARKGKELGICALFSSDGEEIIPFGPNSIKHLSGNYWEVVDAGKKTDNEEEAVMYLTDAIWSMVPGDEDILYTGTIRVFNAEKKQYVDNIELTTPYARVKAVGNTLLVRDDEGNSKIYDGVGKVLEENAGQFSKIGNFYKESINGRTVVLDGELKQLFDTGFSNVNYADGEGNYFWYQDKEENTCILDREGEMVAETGKNITISPQGSTYGKASGYFSCYIKNEDGDTVYGLMKPDGTMAVDFEYDGVDYLGDGYYSMWNRKDDEYFYSLYSESGGWITKDRSESFDDRMISCNREEGRELYFVVADRDYILELNDAYKVGYGLVAARDASSGLLGLFDVFSGEKLLDYEYAEINAAYDRVFAYKDGSYDIYEIKD